MDVDKAILAVATRCADPARVEEFEEWYVGQHLPDVLTVDHFTGARLYKAAGRRAPVGEAVDEGVGYFAVYEIDTRDVDAAMDLLYQNDDRVNAAGRNPQLYVPVLSHTFVAVGERVTKSEALQRSPLPPLHASGGPDG